MERFQVVKDIKIEEVYITLTYYDYGFSYIKYGSSTGYYNDKRILIPKGSYVIYFTGYKITQENMIQISDNPGVYNSKSLKKASDYFYMIIDLIKSGQVKINVK